LHQKCKIFYLKEGCYVARKLIPNQDLLLKISIGTARGPGRISRQEPKNEDADKE
jgi:hypothetical protein